MTPQAAFVPAALSTVVLGIVPVFIAAVQDTGGRVERKACRALDGVEIVYSAAGAGEPALVFVHGGMADRSFFAAQLDALSGRRRVIALDLAGHGESGGNRSRWGVPEFGGDVTAVVDAERLTRVIVFGNSLGGPVALEAALALPGRAIGVVGIDTFQDLAHPQTAEYAQAAADAVRQRAEAFRTDYPGSLKAMVGMLFHKDADPALIADVERRMARTPPATAYAMLSSVVGYDAVPAARQLRTPLRAINGDLYPTDVAAIRHVKPDFDAIVMTQTGHYPMLEKPEEFTRHVVAVVEAIEGRQPQR